MKQFEIAWNGCDYRAAQIPLGLYEDPEAQYVSLYCGFILLSQPKVINHSVLGSAAAVTFLPS